MSSWMGVSTPPIVMVVAYYKKMWLLSRLHSQMNLSTYHHVLFVLDVLVDMNLTDCGGRLIVEPTGPSRDFTGHERKANSMSSTAQRYEKKSEKGVHY